MASIPVLEQFAESTNGDLTAGLQEVVALRRALRAPALRALLQPSRGGRPCELAGLAPPDTVILVDDLEALDLAGGALECRLSAVGDHHLERPSSCSGWSIYDLVNHVNGGGHRYWLLLRGAPAEQLAGTRTQDHVRPNPLDSYRCWQRPLVAAFAEPRALSSVVHHPVGDRSGLDLLRMRTLDLALHAWDLARSIELDETLDPRLVAYLLTSCVYLVEELRAHGLYAPTIRQPPEHTSPLQELLRRTGRS